jgi:transposase-like protein
MNSSSAAIGTGHHRFSRVRRYRRFELSLWDLVEMMAGRGMRARRSCAGWALRPRIRKAWEPFCAPSWGSRRIDETNVKIKGRWTDFLV